WQIEGLRSREIPEDLRAQYDLPELGGPDARPGRCQGRRDCPDEGGNGRTRNGQHWARCSSMGEP
ncbi:hypothetical protein, partial [Oceanidesulfovibrio marinus]|uniref:hypothetical protein n=1 Tax=Oceanidesulfovibrio marinus TaxID=370038 RepID=UPI001ABEEAA7